MKAWTVPLRKATKTGENYRILTPVKIYLSTIENNFVPAVVQYNLYKITLAYT